MTTISILVLITMSGISPPECRCREFINGVVSLVPRWGHKVIMTVDSPIVHTAEKKFSKETRRDENVLTYCTVLTKNCWRWQEWHCIGREGRVSFDQEREEFLDTLEGTFEKVNHAEGFQCNVRINSHPNGKWNRSTLVESVHLLYYRFKSFISHLYSPSFFAFAGHFPCFHPSIILWKTGGPTNIR
jgi:hypothetical protein